MKKRKTVSDDGKNFKKPGQPKIQNLGNQSGIAISASNQTKSIAVVICPNGNTVCCQTDEIKKTVGLLSGKIQKGETSSSVAYKIGSTKTGAGLINVHYEYSETFNDPKTQNILQVDVFFAQSPVTDSVKPNELWIPINRIEKGGKYNQYEIRPLTNHIISELVKSGKIRKTA